MRFLFKKFFLKGDKMAKTLLEKEYEKMTPAQRKRATKAISDMMGMPPQKKKRATTKKKGK